MVIKRDFPPLPIPLATLLRITDGAVIRALIEGQTLDPCKVSLMAVDYSVIGHCYTTARKVTATRPGWRVVVGMAVIHILAGQAVPHAWVSDGRNQWEVTWPVVGTQYMGMVL